MELPTELRFMIFRYLFPKVVPDHGVKVGILKTSRQIYREASSVLYGECRFTAKVESGSIIFRGKVWKRDVNRSMDDVLCGASANMIRNLQIEVTVGERYMVPKSIIGPRMKEEFELYALRDSIRKFTDYM